MNTLTPGTLVDIRLAGKYEIRQVVDRVARGRHQSRHNPTVTYRYEVLCGHRMEAFYALLRDAKSHVLARGREDEKEFLS